MVEPIMKFKNQEEAEALMKEWKNRLFLNNWIIKLKINVPIEEMNDNLGLNTFQYTNHCSLIKIAKTSEEYDNDCLLKNCDECTLIHELLHLKMAVMGGKDTYEAAFLSEHQHMLLEQMAKSLLMAKYNLPYSWFENADAVI